MLIQESKFKQVDRFLVRSIWDNRFKNWEFIPSVGASGVIWDTRIASKVDVQVGDFSLSVQLDLQERGLWWVTNVYGPTNSTLRNGLWDELYSVYGLCNPHWCVGAILM